MKFSAIRGQKVSLFRVESYSHRTCAQGKDDHSQNTLHSVFFKLTVHYANSAISAKSVIIADNRGRTATRIVAIVAKQ